MICGMSSQVKQGKPRIRSRSERRSGGIDDRAVEVRSVMNSYARAALRRNAQMMRMGCALEDAGAARRDAVEPCPPAEAS